MLCKIVAEGCCNHMGDLNLAIKMTQSAKECGAHYIKWQKRCPIESTPNHIASLPHPDPHHAFGNNYLEHRNHLEFSIDEHRKLKIAAEKYGIRYACSVWDLTSAQEIITLQPDYIKIPSACNRNINLIQFIYDHFSGGIHISMGMTTQEERSTIYQNINTLDNSRFVIYHTTSEYPCPFENLYLKEIQKMTSLPYTIGFSGHHKGIAADVAAYALGVEWIERHFTLDRTFKGTDQAASLEPDGLRKLCRDLQAIEKTLQFKPSQLTKAEQKNRSKLSII